MPESTTAKDRSALTLITWHCSCRFRINLGAGWWTSVLATHSMNPWISKNLMSRCKDCALIESIRCQMGSPSGKRTMPDHGSVNIFLTSNLTSFRKNTNLHVFITKLHHARVLPARVLSAGRPQKVGSLLKMGG